jgi:hypothetical protein
MVVCLDLVSSQVKRQNSDPTKKTDTCLVTEMERLNAVEKSRIIWSEVVDDCKDAKRAVNILNGVLGRLETKADGYRVSFSAETGMPTSASDTNPTADSLRFSPFFTYNGFVVPAVAGLPNGSDPVMQDGVTPFEGTLDTLGSGLHVPANFDWVRHAKFL